MREHEAPHVGSGRGERSSRAGRVDELEAVALEAARFRRVADGHARRERIRQRLAETTFERAPDAQCTLSIGIATATRAMEDVHAWISEADSALYQAKTLGRNRIVRL
jgi:diguanylate cyclase (GGDEF)-like protein